MSLIYLGFLPSHWAKNLEQEGRAGDMAIHALAYLLSFVSSLKSLKKSDLEAQHVWESTGTLGVLRRKLLASDGASSHLIQGKRDP